MLEHPNIKLAWCAAIGSNDQEMRLEACVLTEPSSFVISTYTLRDWMQLRLPAYMVPVAVYRLPNASAVPVTPSGKRPGGAGAANFFASLPSIDALRAHAEEDYADLSELQTSVADAWREVLQMPLPDLAPTTSFFDLGGSLQAVQLAKKLNELEGRGSAEPITIARLLAEPTLDGMTRVTFAEAAAEAAVANCWREVLKMPLPDLAPTTSFFDLGGSLQAVQLAKLLSELKGRSTAEPIAVQSLLAEPTLEAMARATFGSGGSVSTATPVFDPVVEGDKYQIPLQPSGQSAAATLAKYAGRPGARIVFLTGATGHVGAYILHALVHSAAVGAVVCLVRAKEPAAGLGRLRDAWAKRKLLRPQMADGALFDAKVSCICGEVGQPLAMLPVPRTLHPVLCTPHPAPCTLHLYPVSPIPYTLYLVPCTLVAGPATVWLSVWLAAWLPG